MIAGVTVTEEGLRKWPPELARMIAGNPIVPINSYPHPNRCIHTFTAESDSPDLPHFLLLLDCIARVEAKLCRERITLPTE